MSRPLQALAAVAVGVGLVLPGTAVAEQGNQPSDALGVRLPGDGVLRGPAAGRRHDPGLRRYGYTADATALAAKLRADAAGMLGDGPLMENYDPATGAAMNSRGFSWSAAMLLELEHQG